MNERFLKRKDVVSLTTNISSPLSGRTFKVEQFAWALHIVAKIPEQWSNEGTPCEVLRADAPGWKSGRVRISLEFIPDEIEEEEPESAEAEDSANEADAMQALRAKLDL